MSDAFSALGSFAARLRYEDIPQAAVERTCLVLLDTVAAITAGLNTPEMDALRVWCRASGEGPAIRALLLGSAGVLQELDEGFAAARGHPAIHVIPAALTLAASEAASGRDLITGVVAGYEVAARVGAAMQLRPGTHPHGTWGGIGAAAATGRLRRLAPDHLAAALRIAACLPMATSYQVLRDGSPVRHLWSGLANLTGSMAAGLAGTAFGAPASAATLSLSAIIGTQFDESVATAELGARWDILRGYFKIHACCRHGHASIDAMNAALNGAALMPDDIRLVRVHTYADAVQAMSPAQPARSVLAAKFSLPYVMAVRLIHGETGPAVFTAEMVADAGVQELSRRVEVIEDSELTRRGRGSRGARIEIATRSGQTLVGAVDHSLGDPALPLTYDDVITKFRRLTYPTLGAGRAEAIHAAVMALPSLDSCASLLTELAPLLDALPASGSMSGSGAGSHPLEVL